MITQNPIKQRLINGIVLSPILIAAIVLFFSFARNSSTVKQVSPNLNEESFGEIAPDKLIFLLQYIGVDYGGAVQKNKVINHSEYQEMSHFSSTARQWYLSLRPEVTEQASSPKLEKLEKLIQQKGDWSEVRTLTSKLVQQLSVEFNVMPYPTGQIDLAEGRRYYDLACATCHGPNGDGKGITAPELDPPPSSFQRPENMNHATPYQFFNAITFGINGTAMPSHQQAFTDQERWDIAFYLMTLRAGFAPVAPKQKTNLSVQDLATDSNDDLLRRLITFPEGSPNHSLEKQTALLSTVDYLRQNPPQMDNEERLHLAQSKLEESLEAYQYGRPDIATKLIVEAYLEGFEPLEPVLSQTNRALVIHIEHRFGQYRQAVKSNQSFEEVKLRHLNLQESLKEVETDLNPSLMSTGFAFLQSLTIILREGVEATLLIALMVTYLVSSGYRRLRKHVWFGALAGVAAGVLLWIAAEYFVAISSVAQEVLEGVTSLLAAAVLFSVSLWIIHKVDVQKWKSFIQSKAETALGSGSGFVLALAAFLAVFREAFETVLFYQVLWLKGASMQSGIVLGFVVGLAALTLMLILIFKIGMKLPFKPFFTASGILLGILAIVFAGYGVRELQNMGLLQETVLPLNFKLNVLEIYPTLEGLTLQFGILLSFLLGWLSVYFKKIAVSRQTELKPAILNN